MAPPQSKIDNRTSVLLSEASRKPVEELFQVMGSKANGLTEAEAEERLLKDGPNEVAYEKKHMVGLADRR